MEGVPVEDAIGSNKGFRRPGYLQYAEPGLSYQINKVNFFASVPVAFNRDRLQSVTDKEVTAQTGTYTHRDAAFSDYAVNIGCTIKL